MKTRSIAMSGLPVAILAVCAFRADAHLNPPTDNFLLTIDDSNPSAVVIMTTGLNSSTNFSINTANEGVDLLGFFLANQSTLSGKSLSGSLQGGNLGIVYNDVFGDNYSTGGGNYLDCGLYVDVNSPGQSAIETFSTSQPAFTGSWTINFTSLGISLSDLPTSGSSGNIISGDAANTGAIIGQWEVSNVPEPGTDSLLIIGTLALGGSISYRRYRSA